jgi:hypothetical protein
MTSAEKEGQGVVVQRLVLDVLKAHHPTSVDFSKRLAEQGHVQVTVTVLEMDEQTETLKVVIEGDDIPFERIQEAIADFGASLHSVDEVKVAGVAAAGPESEA